MGVPDHLRIRFAVRADGRAGGEPLAVGHDLVLLKEELAGQLNQTLAAAAAELTRTGQTRWTFGTHRRGGQDHPERSGRSWATRRWSTRAARWAWRCWKPRAPSGSATGRGCAGWYC